MASHHRNLDPEPTRWGVCWAAHALMRGAEESHLKCLASRRGFVTKSSETLEEMDSDGA